MTTKEYVWKSNFVLADTSTHTHNLILDDDAEGSAHGQGTATMLSRSGECGHLHSHTASCDPVHVVDLVFGSKDYPFMYKAVTCVNKQN